MICASEQSVIVAKEIYAKFKKEMQLRGAYFLSSVEAQKVRKTIIVNGALNAKIVGQSAHTIAALSGLRGAEDAKVLVGEVTSVEPSEEFSHEKLSPVLAMYKAESFEDALDKADRLVREGGPGHTSAIYIDERTQGDRLSRFRERMQTYRVLVNTPAAQGGIGDLYNFPPFGLR